MLTLLVNRLPVIFIHYKATRASLSATDIAWSASVCTSGITPLFFQLPPVPEVETFLNRNSKLNGDTPIPFERTGWADNNDSLGRFDLIIGSDLLYEDEHIGLLSSFIRDHSNPACEVIIVDPGRGRKNKLAKKMREIGYLFSFSKPESSYSIDTNFKGHILRFVRTE